MKPIEKPDTQNNDVLYWEQVLKSHNLSMGRAARPRVWINRGEEDEHYVERVSFVGTSADLADVAEKHAGKEISGRPVRPSGHEPD